MKIIGAVLEEVGRPRPYAESRPIRICELELDPPGPGELLVRIEAAGVCRADLSVVDGNRPRPLPMLLGHEAVGQVLELGEGIIDVHVGDRVVMAFLPRCGFCKNCLTDGRLPCSRGSAANTAGELLNGGRRLRCQGQTVNHHLGVSGFASHAVVDRRSAVVVGDDLPPEVAALLSCAVLTGGGAVINVGNPHTGEAVTVVGLGGIGMAALITAVSIGKGDAVGIDLRPERLERALEFGASQVYTPEQAIEAGFKAPIVIEAAGAAAAFETAVTLTAPGGTTVVVGLPHPRAEATLRPLALATEARSIVGSYLGSAVPARDIPRYAQLWREGRLPVEKLITSQIGLADLNQALDNLADGAAIRQVIRFE